MKKMIRLVTILCCATILLSGCKKEEENFDKKSGESQNTTEESKIDQESKDSSSNVAVDTDKVYEIGVLQFVQHDSLDKSYEGFVDGLAELGYIDGENINITLQNASGDQSNCPPIAEKYVNDNVDLILAIATPAAQAVANSTAEIPILVTAVTDPAESGLVESNEVPGGNITGTSDLTPVKEQIQLLKDFVPDAKDIAILYCTNEINSKIQADMAKEYAEELGINVQDATVSSSNEIQQVVQNLVGKVDAIYAPTDNIIAAGMQTVSQVTTPNKIPVICGVQGMVEVGGLATMGIDYYNLGKQTAAQAVKILTGEGDPATMPIEYLKEIDFNYNEEIMNELGLTLPEGY